VVSSKDLEIIRRRAESFLKNAAYLINEGEWDLVIFNLEQYIQLILKYKLLLNKGGYPKTHSIRRLIRELGEFNPEILKLVEDADKLHYIARLEEAYIVSRYLPYEYEEKECKDLYRFVIEVFKPVVEEI
jgi:HEPN domain-containing protein